MRKILVSLLFLIILANITYSISEEDRTTIRESVDYIINSVNNGNIETITQQISPNARPELKTEINKLKGRNLEFKGFSITSFKEKDNTIKVSGIYSVKGPNWSGNGPFMYFTFEKINNKWLLKETNFHKLSLPENILKTMGITFLLIFIIFIPLFIFWILMLINCIKRDFPGDNEKLVWLLVIILTGMIGAIIYYFAVKRKK